MTKLAKSEGKVPGGENSTSQDFFVSKILSSSNSKDTTEAL